VLGEVVAVPLAALGEVVLQPLPHDRDGRPDLGQQVGRRAGRWLAGQPGEHRALAVIEPDHPPRPQAELAGGIKVVIGGKPVQQARRGHAPPRARFRQRLFQLLQHPAVRGRPADPDQRPQRRIRTRHA
jgi:hypothetical protein